MILDDILKQKGEEVTRLSNEGMVFPKIEVDSKLRGFAKAISAGPGVSVIAEVKKASPSKGVIAENFDPVEIAKFYEAHGARAISVLTDQKFFQGHIDYLAEVRAAVDLPVLRKDFIVNNLQIEEARLYGADAILLIARIISPFMLQDMIDQGESYGMDVVVEVHNEAELEAVLRTEVKVIGINNRNLEDFSVDLNTSIKLRKQIPSDIIVISESGISTPDDMKKLKENNFKAALVGESLMRDQGGASLLDELVKAGS